MAPAGGSHSVFNCTREGITGSMIRLRAVLHTRGRSMARTDFLKPRELSHLSGCSGSAFDEALGQTCVGVQYLRLPPTLIHFALEES